MNRCPICYRSHSATVEICDCGHQFEVPQPTAKSARQTQVAAKATCPKCGQIGGAPVSQENNGFGLVMVTVSCRHCQHLFEIERWGLPQMPLLWLGVLLFFIWYTYFADELLRHFILFLVALLQLFFRLGRLLDGVDKPTA